MTFPLLKVVILRLIKKFENIVNSYNSYIFNQKKKKKKKKKKKNYEFMNLLRISLYNYLFIYSYRVIIICNIYYNFSQLKKNFF